MSSQHVGRKKQKLSYTLMEGTVKCSEPLTIFFFSPLIYSILGTMLSDEIYTLNNFVSRQIHSCIAEVRNLPPK